MKEESRIIAGIKDGYRYLERAVVIGGSLLIIGSVMLWCSGWRINLEYSMPRGVYRSSSGEYRSGDLALVRLPGRWSDYVLRRGSEILVSDRFKLCKLGGFINQLIYKLASG